MTARPWLPACCWAALILVATSVPGAHLPRIGVEGADKAAHLALYGVLGWLAARAVRARAAWPRDAVLVLAAIALFGALDEWHQQFIPGRSMDLLDWAADSSGATIGVAIAVLRRPRLVRP